MGLLDGYGKIHLARIVAGESVAVGDELHGASPAPGLHFLVESRSGQRLSAHFVQVRVGAQAMRELLHPRQVPLTLAPRPGGAAAAARTGRRTEDAAASPEQPIDVAPRQHVG